MRASAAHDGANRRERIVGKDNLVHRVKGLAVVVEPLARRTGKVSPDFVRSQLLRPCVAADGIHQWMNSVTVRRLIVVTWNRSAISRPLFCTGAISRRGLPLMKRISGCPSSVLAGFYRDAASTRAKTAVSTGKLARGTRVAVAVGVRRVSDIGQGLLGFAAASAQGAAR